MCTFGLSGCRVKPRRHKKTRREDKELTGDLELTGEGHKRRIFSAVRREEGGPASGGLAQSDPKESKPTTTSQTQNQCGVPVGLLGFGFLGPENLAKTPKHQNLPKSVKPKPAGRVLLRPISTWAIVFFYLGQFYLGQVRLRPGRKLSGQVLLRPGAT